VDQPSAFELGPGELRRFLAEAMGVSDVEGEPEGEASAPGPDREPPTDRAGRDAARRDALAAFLAHPCDRLSVLQGKAAGDLLLDPGTDPAVLHVVKAQGKQAVRQAASEASRQAGIVLYYAAIASALVHHGRRISSFSLPELVRSFQTLVLKQWLPDSLADLFRQALCRCTGRSEDPPAPADA